MKSTISKTDLYFYHPDHLGSSSWITDANGRAIQHLQYLPFGETCFAQRTTGWNTMYSFSGKERDEESSYSYFGARYYDSELSIWLSVDPMAHKYPGLTPYNYCMNSPVMYQDPNGELAWWVLPVVFAAVYGIANTAINYDNGNIQNFWQGLGYFALGAVNGFLAGLTWSAGIAGVTSTSTLAQIGGGLILAGKGVNAISTVSSAIFGDTENAWKLMWGKAYVENIGQALARHTWEGLQTWGGYNYTQFRNADDNVSRVDYFGGATFATKEDKEYRNGVSIGNYVNINIADKITGNFLDRVLADPLFMHEYGHTIDSRAFGISYLFAIGIPSIISAAGTGNHDRFWTEMRANRRAKKYFKKYGIGWYTGSSTYYWGTLEDNYPTR